MDRFVIRFIETPDSQNPDEIIRWFCAVFGLSTEKDSIEGQILQLFIKKAYGSKGISSTELTAETSAPRSTVIYHLNRLIDSGLVVRRGRQYRLRASEMQKTIEEIEYDVEREMRRMMDIAVEFDKLMGAKAKRSSTKAIR